MNGICGYLRLDGAPVEPGKLEAMQQAMAYWGVDGMSQWHEGPMGLGCQFSFCTPERDADFPYHDRDRGWVITVGAFLDNREELIEEFGLGPEKRRSVADTELVRLAYGRWGEECVHHLTGDWHFALWDLKEKKLFLARDHHGNTGLCYTKGAGFFAFGSGKKALLALPEVPKRPNLLRLAQILTAWHGDGVMTAYEQIYRLPPAHCLTLSKGKLNVRRYWFAENSPEVRFPRDEDYLEAFLEQYDRAVRARLRANFSIGATLSGGLDSGSVSVLAARELAKKGERLAAYTSVPFADASPWHSSRTLIGDESGLARATATHAGNIDIHWIRAEGVSPLAGIKTSLEIHDEPGHTAGNAFWLIDLFQTVRERAHRVLLTGQGGNTTVSRCSGPVSLAPFLWPGRWDDLFHRFPELRKRYGLSFTRAIRRFLLAPVVSPLRIRWQRGHISGSSAFLSYSAIDSRFAGSLEVYRLMRKENHDPFFRGGYYDPIAHLCKLVQPGRWTGGAIWGENSGAYGMEMRDPTLDKSLMAFCLGLPESCHYVEGMERAVIRRAFKGLLPDEVRLNTLRGKQAADIAYRIARNSPEIEDTLHLLDGHALSREVLDLAKMRRVFTSVKNGPTPGNSFESATILLLGLGVGLFLLRFK